MTLISTCSSLKVNMYSWRRLLQCQKVDAVTNKHKLRTDYKCETPAFVSGNSWQLHHKFWRNGALFWDYRQLAIDMAHSAWQELMLLILKNYCALYLPETKGELKVLLCTMFDEIGTREKLDKWLVQDNIHTTQETNWPWMSTFGPELVNPIKVHADIENSNQGLTPIGGHFTPIWQNWSKEYW